MVPFDGIGGNTEATHFRDWEERMDLVWDLFRVKVKMLHLSGR